MNDKFMMHSSDLPFAVPLRDIQQAISTLKPNATEFNKLSVSHALAEQETNNIVKTLEMIQKYVSNYVQWKQNALLNIENIDDTRNEINNLMSVAGAMEQSPKLSDRDVDPRALLRLDVMSTKIVPIISTIWFTFLSVDYKNDITLRTYVKLFARTVNNLCNVLDATMVAFGQSSCVHQFELLDTSIGADPYELKFVLNDHVVAFSPEEIAEQKRLEEEAAEAKRKAEELEEAKQFIKAQAMTVLDAYNKQLKTENLKIFRLSEQSIMALKDPKNMKDLDMCVALYRLLMAMSNSVRYMPGDEGSDFDRIMGSFQELDQDILKYGQQFTVYLHEYELSHNDVVLALSAFSAANGKIVAQYVDTKEYIEEFGDDPKSPKTIHLLVMK